MYTHPDIANAAKVLDGKELTRSEALKLMRNVRSDDLMDLLSLANRVRKRFAPAFGACSIINAKSGRCDQNCRFCAQSAHYHTGIETYELLPPDEVLAAAREVYATGVRTFGYVTSGYGYDDPECTEFRQIIDTIDLLHRELPELKLCVSLGILSMGCTKKLAAHGVWRYNMNLQTNPARYAELVADTHSIDDKLRTIRYMQECGITNCTGGIIGLGESPDDRVALAFAVRELDVEGITLNILLPIRGTPVERNVPVTPAEAAKTFAIFRLVNPTKMIKLCAGRETTVKDFQGLLMLSGLNAIMTGGYLTTRGREVSDDLRFLRELEEF